MKSMDTFESASEKVSPFTQLLPHIQEEFLVRGDVINAVLVYYSADIIDGIFVYCDEVKGRF
jgi:hypothetical protein